MSEYIDRETSLKACCDECNGMYEEEPCEPSDCIIRCALKNIPAADVVKRDCFDRLLEENDMLRATLVPVRRGHWIPCEPHNTMLEGFECSECGAQFQGVRPDRYCGHCGARMEGSQT